jgi:nifR3 family TIM-barrel protein
MCYMNSFWHKLKKPIIALAPMADVTDAAFRRVIAKYSKPSGPDVMYTEFVSADGLYHTREKRKMSDEENPLMKDLIYSESERPIVAQFFTGKPEMMEYAVNLAVELGFDGVDINMGCPDKSIEKQCAGASLIKNPKLAKELVSSAKRASGVLPVSVKTRIGYNKDELDEWLPELLECELDALIIHARTRKEMSKVPAHMEVLPRAIALRDSVSVDTLIIGNGDVLTPQDALEKVQETGVDGMMIGRGIFGTPWLFSDDLKYKEVSIKKRCEILLEHTKLFEELLPNKNFSIMKKHYKAYLAGFDGVSILRAKLMDTRNAVDVENILVEADMVGR